jgi:Sulfotransferase domain
MLWLSLGVPRSGTILVFNMLREILTRKQVPFRQVNTNYPETAQFFETHDYKDNVLMHAHNVLPPVQQALTRKDVIAFFNFRDPRDVLVSMMRLHDYTFEKCMELTDISFAHYRIARKFRRIMFIPYDHLINAPEAFIFQLAQRLGVYLPLTVVAEIEKATSLEAHKKVMKDVARATEGVQVRRNPKRTLKESTTHFINDRHIQSGRSGRWKKELTAAQQREVNEHYQDLLQELGYL